jgi:aminopeptidase 2
VEEWEIVQFATSPRMSTYLATWAVGDFEYVLSSPFPLPAAHLSLRRSISSSYTSPLTSLPVSLSVYASRTAGHLQKGQGQLTLDTLKGVMPIYEKLFDIPHELGKLDVLVCDEFDAGAMEGYGLYVPFSFLLIRRVKS